MAVVLACVGVFVYLQLRGDLLESVDMGLQSRAQVIVSNARRPDPSLGAARRALIDADEAFAQVLTPTGRILESTPAVARSALVNRAFLRTVNEPTFTDRRPPGLDPSRLLVAPTRSGGGRVFVVVGATESNTNEALGRLRLAFEVAFPAALLVCSLVGWLLAVAALRPVERMRREAEEISDLDPSRRLAIPATEDTLSRLARTLNSTFDRLQEAHERERRFVDDASHELRTPLTILKAEVDTALTGTHDSAELQRTLESASEEIEHLVRIAEGLLVLARSNHGRIPIDTVPTPLSELVEQSRQSFAPRARGRGVRVEGYAEHLVVHLDRTRVRQALDNLVENSLRHTPPGGVISIAATRSGVDAVVVVVEDSGVGFEGDALGHAFQPFNSPHTGHAGAGLGLAIVDAIAHAHGGSARAENLPRGGARVTLTLHAPSVPTAVPRTAEAPSPSGP